MLESLAIIESAVSSRHGLLMSKKSKTATSSTRSDLRASCQSNDVTVWLTYTGRTAFSITNPRRKFKHNTNQSKTNSFFALELSHSNHHDAHVDTIQTPSFSDPGIFRVKDPPNIASLGSGSPGAPKTGKVSTNSIPKWTKNEF